MSGTGKGFRRRWAAVAVAVAAVVAGGSAFAAVLATDTDGVIVCIKNSSGALREVSAASDCNANEHAAELAGPGSTAANALHANEADHADTADFAAAAGDADTLDGYDSTQLMRDYQRVDQSFDFPPGVTFFASIVCPGTQHALNLGVLVTTFDDLNPKPIVLDDGGGTSAAFWQKRMENRDPDTNIQFTLSGACATVNGATSFARGSGGEIVLDAGVD